MNNIKYIHEEEAHNLTAPSIIVPLLMNALKPKSVIDIGCGIGTFLHEFKKHGITDFLGVDGKWVNRKKLSKHIPISHFQETNLEKGVKLNRRYDLALCIEVVEHLKEESADVIVEDLTKLSDIIVFSAAIPGQFGQNHLNEQWPDYWIKKFEKHNYIFLDIFRPAFWNNDKIDRWYKQNMFLVVKKEKQNIYQNFEPLFEENILNLVHPEYYNLRVNEIIKVNTNNIELKNQLSDFKNGQAALSIYIKSFAKFLLRKLGIRRKQNG